MARYLIDSIADKELRESQEQGFSLAEIEDQKLGDAMERAKEAYVAEHLQPDPQHELTPDGSSPSFEAQRENLNKQFEASPEFAQLHELQEAQTEDRWANLVNLINEAAPRQEQQIDRGEQERDWWEVEGPEPAPERETTDRDWWATQEPEHDHGQDAAEIEHHQMRDIGPERER